MGAKGSKEQPGAKGFSNPGALNASGDGRRSSKRNGAADPYQDPHQGTDEPTYREPPPATAAQRQRVIQEESGYMPVTPVFDGTEAKNAPSSKSGYMAIDPNWLGEQNQLLTTQPWFRGVYSRRQATVELQNLPAGMFLVRVSSVPGKYAISTNFGYKVENMLILPSWDPRKKAQGETLYRLGTASKTFFANVPDLIVYYCTHAFYTDSFGAKHKLLAPEGSAQAHSGYLDVRPGNVARPVNTAEAEESGDEQEASNDAGYLSVAPTSMTNDEAADALSHALDAELDENILDFPSGPVAPNRRRKQRRQPAVAAAGPVTNPFDALVSKPEHPSQAKLCLEDSELRVYQELFRLADVDGAGSVGAVAGVTFFRNSGLSDQELGGIWALADVGKAGMLNEGEFFDACKLVSLAQCGVPIAVAHLSSRTSLPDFGPLTVEAKKKAGHVSVAGGDGSGAEA